MADNDDLYTPMLDSIIDLLKTDTDFKAHLEPVQFYSKMPRRANDPMPAIHLRFTGLEDVEDDAHRVGAWNALSIEVYDDGEDEKGPTLYRKFHAIWMVLTRKANRQLGDPQASPHQVVDCRFVGANIAMFALEGGGTAVGAELRFSVYTNTPRT